MTRPGDTALAGYAAAREALLRRVTAALAADERFIAAWLAGSAGRGEADAVSDLDLTVVVADAQRDRLCARPWMTGAGTTGERLRVIQQFGTPAVIHENHYNAPEGGSFTFTLYAGSALMVDWSFVPLSDARRPPRMQLLFAHAEIPRQLPQEPAAPADRAAAASERVSFFWMLAAVAARFRARGDALSFHAQLQHLGQVAGEIQALVEGGQPQPTERATVALTVALLESAAAQAAALREACSRVLRLMPAVDALGGYVPPSPMGELELLLGLKDNT